MKKPRIRIVWYPNIYTLELIHPRVLNFVHPAGPGIFTAVIGYGFIKEPFAFEYLAFGKYFCNSLRFA